MQPRHYALGVAAALALTATSAEAAVTFDSDAEFLASPFAGGTIAEAQGIDGGTGAQAQVGVPTIAPAGSNVGSAFNVNWQDGPVDFTVSYDQANFTFRGTRESDTLFDLSKEADFSGANSVFVRVAGAENSRTILRDLAFEDADGNDTGLLSGELDSGTGSNVENYIGFNYANLSDDWSLTGQAELTGDDFAARPGFQVKIDDSVVPLPAAAWLMISGLAGVGYTAYRGRKAATATA
ncbi:MAG: VPLPA-CTERM sorting domain-containing protein [Alphaproteobacteria bacterium]